MARHDRYTLCHIYQPTTPRQAYGRRADSAHLMGDLSPWVHVITPQHALAASSEGIRLLACPMPRGGIRWLLYCPLCGNPTTRLYARTDLVWLRPGACRRCWGMRYWSQYHGRRAEADRVRIEALEAVAQRTYSPGTRARRLARVRALKAVCDARVARFEARQSQAEMLWMLPVLLLDQARRDRDWRRIVHVALKEPPAMRELIAAQPDAPAWAAELLRTPLSTDQTDGLLQLSGQSHDPLIREETINAWREAYAAATQRRRQRKAA